VKLFQNSRIIRVLIVRERFQFKSQKMLIIRRVLVGLSSGNIPVGSCVCCPPNSYAFEDGCDYCWISGKQYQFEWPNGAIKPKWNGKGDVVGCGLLLNPENEVSIFFTGNGILIGQSPL
jgi:hypothetical protein